MNIPIVINNFNRLTSVKNMVNFLLERGNNNIYILDNDSSYKPLWKWYSEIENYKNVHIIKLEKNYEYQAIWATGFYRKLNTNFYYTDPDIELNENMPLDWQEQMLNLLNTTGYSKIALALRIDDIPDYYPFKKMALENELKWWSIPYEGRENTYKADTDTTFALYKPNAQHSYQSLRLAGDFTARHLSWYINPENIDKEELYYLQHIKNSTQFSRVMKEKIKNK